MSVVNFRTDERSEKALAELMADGATASDAIRRALVDAVRLRRREQMRSELPWPVMRQILKRAVVFLRKWANCVRGDVYRLRASRQAKGHEQQSCRFGVVLQSDDLMLSTVLIAPTSRSALPQIFRPTIAINGEDTQVLVEQSLAVSFDRLGDLVDHVSHDEQLAIDDALRLVLELD